MKAMWQEAKNLKGDIICVQETHFLEGKSPKCTHKLFPYVITANAKEKKRKENRNIDSHKNSVSIALHSTVLDQNGRYIILVYDINNITYTIANIYAPNTHQIHFLCKVLKKIHQERKGSLIICGDFNAIVDHKLDSTAKSHDRLSLHTTILLLLHTTTRIDLFVSDLQILSKVSKAEIHLILWSDHAPRSRMTLGPSICGKTM